MTIITILTMIAMRTMMTTETIRTMMTMLTMIATGTMKNNDDNPNPTHPQRTKSLLGFSSPWMDGWMRTKLGIPYCVNTWVSISQLRGQRNFVLHEA